MHLFDMPAEFTNGKINRAINARRNTEPISPAVRIANNFIYHGLEVFQHCDKQIRGHVYINVRLRAS